MTAEQIIATLAIVDENILSEAARQAVVFIDAARYRVSKMKAVSEAKIALEQGEAETALRIRTKRAQAGDKVTEAYIKQRVVMSPRCQELRTAVALAERQDELAKLILEAFRMRRDAIKIIAEAQGYEAAREEGIATREAQERKLRKEARRLTSQHKITQEGE